MNRTVKIAGTGSYLPEGREGNRDLFARQSIQANFDVERAREALREVPDAAHLTPEEVFDQWARQVTGIEERRILMGGDAFTTEHMCAEAGARALAMAGMDLEDVDLVVLASVTPSDSVPNAACTVGSLMGRTDLGGFSLNGACAGFLHAIGTAQGLVATGSANTILAISGDTLSRITSYADPKTAVLFSDGAGAAVVTAADENDNGRIEGAPYFAADYAREHLYLRGQGWEEEHEPNARLHMGGGPRVLRRAIMAMAGVSEVALDRAGLSWDDVDYVVPHQANLRITRGLEKHLELDGRVIHTIQRYGNASASTVAVALDELLRGRHGALPDPARILLAAVGGGYTMGALSLRWAGGPQG